MSGLNSTDLTTALVIATYVITLLGVCLGAVSAINGFIVSRRRQELSELRTFIDVSQEGFISTINENLDAFNEERKVFRSKLLANLVTAEHMKQIHRICGEYLHSVGSVDTAHTIHTLMDYHELQSSLIGMLSNENSDDIGWDLNYISSMIGTDAKLDSALLQFLLQLWSDGFFHRFDSAEYFQEWYKGVFGSTVPPLVDIRHDSAPVFAYLHSEGSAVRTAPKSTKTNRGTN